MDSVFVALKNANGSTGWFSIEYISLLIAFLAVFIGPIIAHFTAVRTVKSQTIIAKEQMSIINKNAEREINAKVLSTNRQDWINTLRNNIAEFLSLRLAITNTALTDNERASIIERIFTIKFRISLLLNPDEDDHKELDGLLDLAIQTWLHPENTTDNNNAIGTNILTISKPILKREWVRVKNLE